MESSFKTADLDEAVSGLQPGDDITFYLELKNENEETTNWYMTNEVLYSLEDRSANSATGGGAYTYELTYTDKEGKEEVLFSSNTVGGEVISKAGEGLSGGGCSCKYQADRLRGISDRGRQRASGGRKRAHGKDAVVRS